MHQTIKQLLQYSSKKINYLDAELIISHVIDKPREFLISHNEYKIGKIKSLKIKKLIKKREQKIPLAYLIGHKKFYRLNFIVNKHTLIPRPDTEVIVTEALKHISTLAREHKNILLIDVGTGSGCIPISILKNLQNNKFKNLQTFAIDISKKALQIAKKNAKKHNVNINFFHGNLLEPISNLKFQISNLIITANLPYLTEDQFQNEPSIQHEPKTALVAKNNGLALYEKILKQILQLTKTYNLKPTIYLEIDPYQTTQINTLIKKYLPKTQIEIKKDLSGLDRVVEINIHKII